jgi:hypothetical protein
MCGLPPDICRRCEKKNNDPGKFSHVCSECLNYNTRLSVVWLNGSIFFAISALFTMLLFTTNVGGYEDAISWKNRARIMDINTQMSKDHGNRELAERLDTLLCNDCMYDESLCEYTLDKLNELCIAFRRCDGLYILLALFALLIISSCICFISAYSEFNKLKLNKKTV